MAAEPETTRDPTPVDNLDEDERLTKFKQDITKDADVTAEQREAANADMRFINVKGGMWEGFLSNDFTEDRVRMEFDLVSNFLETFLGKFEQKPIGVEYKPDDGTTTDEDAELLNGIYRADFLNHSGMIATDNAMREAVTCGVGAMKLGTLFEDEEDPENDHQRIEWRPIYNAYNSVYWDEAAKRIDKRDARWCTILTSYTADSFEAEYPGKSAVSAYTPESLDFNNSYTSTPSLIYVAERYEVIKQTESVFVYNNLEASKVETYSVEDHELIEDELRASPVHKFVRERKILRRTIEKSIFSGEEFLQPPKRLAGKWIPIIPFYAYRSYVDGAEWYRGLIRKLIDPQRTFNVEMSQVTENAASAGQEVPIFLRQQVENPDIKSLWANKNNKPYLVVDPATDDDGNILASGPIAYSKPPMLDGNTNALLQIVPQFVQDTTGGVPQETMNPDASGKAIRALMEREDARTTTVVKNFKDSIVSSGEVYQSIVPEVYNKPRILRTINKEGREAVTELSKVVMDEETGRLVESNTFFGKKFRAYPDIGPRYETLREQTVEEIKGAIDAVKGSAQEAVYMPVLLGMLFENISGVGIVPLKDMNRRLMLTQGLVKPETEEEQAIIEQAKQQQQQPDAQQQLIEAAAAQQQAEARSLDSSSIQKIADAKKKGAETMEIIAGLGMDQERLNMEADKFAAEQRTAFLESLQGLPIQ